MSHLTRSRNQLWSDLLANLEGSGSNLTLSEAELIAAARNTYGGSVSAKTTSRAALIASLANAAGGNVSEKTHSEDQMLAALATALGGTASALSSSFEESLAIAVDETSGGGGEAPLVFADFKNGVYEIEGAASSLAAIFEEDTDWSAFNAGMITGGTGLVRTGTAGGPKVVDALAVDFIVSGVTVVAEVNLITEGAFNSVFLAEIVDLPGFNTEFIATLNRITANSVSTPEDFVEEENPGGAGVKKAALTISPTGVSLSVGGAAAITAAYVSEFAPTALCFSIQRGAIEKLTFLAPVAAAGLPALSAS